jgi:hypothetical protein
MIFQLPETFFGASVTGAISSILQDENSHKMQQAVMSI